MTNREIAFLASLFLVAGATLPREIASTVAFGLFVIGALARSTAAGKRQEEERPPYEFQLGGWDEEEAVDLREAQLVVEGRGNGIIQKEAISVSRDLKASVAFNLCHNSASSGLIDIADKNWRHDAIAAVEVSGATPKSEVILKVGSANADRAVADEAGRAHLSFFSDANPLLVRRLAKDAKVTVETKGDFKVCVTWIILAPHVVAQITPEAFPLTDDETGATVAEIGEDGKFAFTVGPDPRYTRFDSNRMVFVDYYGEAFEVAPHAPPSHAEEEESDGDYEEETDGDEEEEETEEVRMEE